MNDRSSARVLSMVRSKWRSRVADPPHSRIPEPPPHRTRQDVRRLCRHTHHPGQLQQCRWRISDCGADRRCQRQAVRHNCIRRGVRGWYGLVAKQYDDSLQVTGIFGELRQVVSNLMLNSLDAIREGGRVTLRASRSRNPVDGSSCIRITIADNGQGIRTAALPRIFEPFFTTKGLTGNGLGLWVGKQIIEKHGGSIWVRSSTCAPQGTTFSIVLQQRAH
jgi:signal transduction histidine kinase